MENIMKSMESDVSSSSSSSAEYSKIHVFHNFSKEMLKEMFEVMRSEEASMQKERLETSTLPFAAIPTSIVQIIFHICEKLQQPMETRYLAVELYDRFVSNLFLAVAESIWPDMKVSLFDSEKWRTVSARLGEQSLLRVATCVALASKFVSHDRKTSMKSIQQFLCNCGHPFSLKSIIASEMRIYKFLNYKLHFPSRQTHAQLLIEMVFLPETIDKKLLQRLSYKVIDVTYLYHQEIFHKLFFYATGCWERTEDERRKFVGTELNNIYIAAAIVFTAFTFAYPTQSAISDQLATNLDLITEIPSNDIISLSKIITMVVLQH
ncbi:hypothetical protein LSTR_LSTR002703 [Laodelphax striatellus]|uniref:Uncharacterized protein n=1 Tax=Laodelphax striatellus TaxID=195883 RepID=A0A482X712_LAOST|nr:hypothetical protein LSTR_LSTR002703 [Laodelphax striatellus]